MHGRESFMEAPAKLVGDKEQEKAQIDSETRNNKYKIASSVDGRIKEVLVGFGPLTRGGLFVMADVSWNGKKMSGTEYGGTSLVMIKTLLSTLPEGVKLRVVARSDANRDGNVSLLKEFYSALQTMGLDSSKVKLEIIPNRNQDITRAWLRDRLFLSADNKKIFAPHIKDGNDSNNKFLSELAIDLGLEIVHCPFYFEGGDIKVVDGKMYMGTRILMDNLQDRRAKNLQEEYQKLRQEFSDFFGMEIVVVGEQDFLNELNRVQDADSLSSPPLFHLDLYFTPLGNNAKGQPMVAIGDVSLFYKIIEEFGDDWPKRLRDSFGAVKQRKKQELMGFNSNKVNEGIIDDGVRNVIYTGARGDFESFLKRDDRRTTIGAATIKRVSLYLEMVAEEAKQNGFEVVRLPLMPKADDSQFDVSVGGSALITYNNSLVEDFQDSGKHRKRVWLPNYGVAHTSRKKADGKREPTDMLEIIDREAERILRSAGCEVQNIDFGVEHTVDDGSLNCRLLEIREI